MPLWNPDISRMPSGFSIRVLSEIRSELKIAAIYGGVLK